MKKSVAYIFTIIGVLLYLFQALSAQKIDAESYVIRHFGMEDGLPQSSVNDIIQSEDGYLWLATYGGIVRFDGQTFTTFDRSNTEGMVSDRAIRLYEDSKGGIWFFVESAENSIMRLFNGSVKTYQFPNEKGFILTFEEDEEGLLWMTAFNKVYSFQNDAFNEVIPIYDADLAKKAMNSTFGLYMITQTSLLKTFNSTAVVIEEKLDKKFGSSIMSMVEYPKNSGIFFYGTNNNGIIVDRQGVLSRFDNSNGLPSNSVLRLQVDSGVLSVFLVNNVAYWDGSKFKEFELPSFPDGAQKKNYLKDREGNYWIGTSGDGLLKFRPTFISMIDKNDGLNNDKLLSLEMLNDGTFLFSTNCGGIYEWDGQQLRYSQLHKYYDGLCNWSVFQDSKNRIWIGSNDVYVTEAINQKGKHLVLDKEAPGALVFSISEDKSGQIWVGTSSGVFVYDEKNDFKKISTSDGLYNNDVRAIYEDNSGIMWLGTNQGLNTIKDGVVAKFELLPSNKAGQPYVRAIHEDDEGTIWIGTYGNGLFRIREGAVHQLTIKDGLFDNIVSTINEDEFGNLWLGSNRGISQVSRQDLNRFIIEQIEQIPTYSYGVADGMNSSETNGGFQPSTIYDTDGNIFFPTVEGVAVISTRHISRNQTVPPVYIEGIKVHKSEIPLTSSISIPFDTPYIEINYTAIAFNEPEKLHFKYKMDGLNDDWIDVGNRRSAIYSKIPPGTYKFTVIASNSDGVWNNEGDTVEIIVPTPFWQKNWFYTLMFFSFAMVGYSFYYSRTQRLTKDNERQKWFTEQLIDSQEQERRRIASELHDGLGQQILVIKNRVQLAKNLCRENSPLIEQLDEILHSSEISIEDVRTISHNLRPVLLEKFGLTEAINNLCEDLALTSATEWSYHIDNIDGMLPNNKEINLYRVLQEGANNVLKHAQAEQASIMVQKKEEMIKVTIWDDGKGLVKDTLANAKGLGLTGMKERIETLAGKFSIESTIGQGTTLRIEIPVLRNA
jgi:signal transduction histidine kinase/ligand-binding sensor domain-containing protein